MKLTKLIFCAPTASWSPLVVVELLMLSLLVTLIEITNLTNQASAFHLSFGHRLRKYQTNQFYHFNHSKIEPNKLNKQSKQQQI